MNQRTGTAITAHCCENEQTGDLLHGNAGVWACTLLNHTSITKEQKERGITAYEMQAEQSDSTMTSEQFLETVPATFGEALYIFVPIKDRHGKHAWNSIPLTPPLNFPRGHPQNLPLHQTLRISCVHRETKLVG